MVGPILLSCANVPLTDHEFCGSLGPSGASCAHFLTNETRNMDLQEFAAWWDDLKDPKVATKLSTITDWKGIIEKLCNDESGVCSEDLQKQVDSMVDELSAATRLNGGG